MPEFAKGGYIEGSADGIAPITRSGGCDYIIPAETFRRAGGIEAIMKMREALGKATDDHGDVRHA